MKVLVTGAAKRIGNAIARRFHAAGHEVILHCHQSTESANKFAKELNLTRLGSASVQQLDLQRFERFDDYACKCGDIDVLVNNASAFYPTTLGSVTTDQFDELINTNLKAPYFLTQSFLPYLKAGSIINIIDIYAEKPLPQYSAYSMSKAGLLMMTRTLAQELAPDVRVNAVSPGAILWPGEVELSDDEKKEMLGEIPMGRIGEPENIADAVLFLAEDANYMTGQVLKVDGGSSI